MNPRGQFFMTQRGQFRMAFDTEVALPHTFKGAKYRNPANMSETWAGRGVRPRWLQAALKDGHKIEEFAITQW
jgi:H-NS histone family protein